MKQKIAAIYADAQSEHKTDASVQQQINEVLAANPSTPAATDDQQSLLIDTTA